MDFLNGTSETDLYTTATLDPNSSNLYFSTSKTNEDVISFDRENNTEEINMLGIDNVKSEVMGTYHVDTISDMNRSTITINTKSRTTNPSIFPDEESYLGKSLFSKSNEISHEQFSGSLDVGNYSGSIANTIAFQSRDVETTEALTQSNENIDEIQDVQILNNILSTSIARNNSDYTNIVTIEKRNLTTDVIQTFLSSEGSSVDSFSNHVTASSQDFTSQLLHDDSVWMSDESSFSDVSPFDDETIMFNSTLPYHHFGQDDDEIYRNQMSYSDNKPITFFIQPPHKWETVMDELGLLWNLHKYIFGILFLTIAVYSICCAVRLRKRANLLSQGYFLVLNLLLVLTGTTRTLWFLIDGYNSSGILYNIITNILFCTAFPCLTSSFTIQILALLHALQIQCNNTTASSKQRKLVTLALIVLAHFIMFLITSIAVVVLQNAYSSVMLLICLIIFISWGLLLSTAFFIFYRRLHPTENLRKQEQIEHSNTNHNYSTEAAQTVDFINTKLTIYWAIELSLFTAICLFLLILLHVYRLVSIINFTVSSNKAIITFSSTWSWFAYESSMRFMELLMVFSITWVVILPNSYEPPINMLSCCRKKFILINIVHLFYWCHLCVISPKLQDEDCQNLELNVTENTNGSSKRYANGKSHYNSIPTSKSSTATMESKTFTPLTTKSSPTKSYSMLVKENGVIRFRRDGDPLQEPLASSTDDELDSKAENNCKDSQYLFTSQSLGRKLKWTNQNLTHTSSEIVANQKCRQQLNGNNGNITGLRDSFHLKNVRNIKRSESVPNTANSKNTNSVSSNTPQGFLTPKSICSSDYDRLSMFSLRPPSSIHLHESIDKALHSLHADDKSASVGDNSLLEDKNSTTPNYLFNPGDKCTTALDLTGNVTFPVAAQSASSESTNEDIMNTSSNSICNNNKTRTLYSINRSIKSKTGFLRHHLQNMRAKGTSAISLDGIERSKSYNKDRFISEETHLMINDGNYSDLDDYGQITIV